MRIPSLLFAVILGLFVSGLGVGGCQTPGATVAPLSRGEKFFRTKCSACHPDGGQGVGPAIDATIAASFLERGKSAGRHGVPEVEWEPLLAFLGERFSTQAAVPATAVAGAETGAAPPPSTTAAVVGERMLGGVGTGAGTGAVDGARGARWFEARCNKCHPGTGRGVGPALTARSLPGPLKRSPTSGRHDVPPDEFDSLLAYIAGRVGAPVPTPASGAALAGSAVPGGVVPATNPIAPAPLGSAPLAATAVSSSVDAAAGAAFFQTKCMKCHLGGRNIVGRTLPGLLQPDVPGKHGVPSAVFESLLSHLVTLGAVRGAAAAAPAGVSAGTTAPSGPAVAGAASPTGGTVAGGAGCAPASTAGPTAPGQGATAATPVRPTTAPIPAHAGMVPCTCNCQCPPGAPPAALPAACICQCTCPR